VCFFSLRRCVTYYFSISLGDSKLNPLTSFHFYFLLVGPAVVYSHSSSEDVLIAPFPPSFKSWFSDLFSYMNCISWTENDLFSFPPFPLDMKTELFRLQSTPTNILVSDLSKRSTSFPTLFLLCNALLDHSLLQKKKKLYIVPRGLKISCSHTSKI